MSVVLVYLNGARFLDEAIRSVVSQTYDWWELLLVDDGSIDDSPRIARSWTAHVPGRLRCLEHPQHANRGISASRNLGLRHAAGALVAFLDADDIWVPEKLERQVGMLAAHPEAGMVYGRTEYWYSWREDVAHADRDYVPSHRIPADTLVTPPKLLTAFLRDAATVPCICSILVRRDVVTRFGGFDEAFPGLYEDQAFYAKVCLHTTVFVSDECLERYRQHDGSLCAMTGGTKTERDWRQRYLRWLSRYVSEAAIVDRELTWALRARLWLELEPSTPTWPGWARRVVRQAKRVAVRLADRLAR